MDITNIKKKIKDNRCLNPIYEKLKLMRDNVRERHRLYGRYTFENRSSNSAKLCIVLAGYKEYLYPAVFGRLKKFSPSDMDICILTSGLYSKNVSALCKENGWSYLSTKRNNVSLIQNIAINLHPHADFIFKLDEDIFITEKYFENMIRAYQHAEQGDYNPGVLAPLIPINGYGNLRILQKLGLVETYTKLFEIPKYITGPTPRVYMDAEAAQFFWGKDGTVPSIDEMNAMFANDLLQEFPCAIQFSIGAILFRREFWRAMGFYPVSWKSNIAIDERHLCICCCRQSRPLMVSENVVVGHLSYMPQNAIMKEYFLTHQEVFNV